MYHKSDSIRNEIVNKISASCYEKMNQPEAEVLDGFIKKYFSRISIDDLQARSIIDLYGSVVSQWQYMNRRRGDDPCIRVYNPQFEQHGWQSTHTIVEIITEEMPFTLSSVRMALNELGMNIHLICHCGGLKLVRDDAGKIQEIQYNGSAKAMLPPQEVLSIEIDKQSDPEILDRIYKKICKVISDVIKTVQDWKPMCDKMDEVIANLEEELIQVKNPVAKEKLEFLKWVKDDNLTFLGYSKLETKSAEGGMQWFNVPDSELGILKGEGAKMIRSLSDLPEFARKELLSSDPVLIGKTDTASTVHRPTMTDFISVKCFNENKEVIGEHRFVGLYTAVAYNRSPQYIPLLRMKVDNILKQADTPTSSHDGKALVNILENLPRDDLFQANEDQLFELATGILQIQERQKIKLFIRKDLFGRYYSCLVFVPREIFNSKLRIKMQDVLQANLGGHEVNFETKFSESPLARIHFIVRISQGQSVDYNTKQIENLLVDIARNWQDNLREALVENYGEEKGNQLFNRYRDGFPSSYQETFVARTAVYDILHIESLEDVNQIAMSFYRPLEEAGGLLRFKLFQPNFPITLSDVIPMLECLGLRVISERPHVIDIQSKGQVWINDFSVVHTSGEDLNADQVSHVFQEAFYHIWLGHAENDDFNRLVLGAKLSWREVTILRAYAKYLWQIGFTFSQSYIEITLANNSHIAKDLIELFYLRFDPAVLADDKTDRINAVRQRIKENLEEVSNLDEDRILRRYVDVIMATLRTNFFQRDEERHLKKYISFKLDCKAIPELPLPKPMYEIFVYSPSVEAVHLRGAKVARGGLRWSDRKEDFRREVLGLVKAQQVKNSVIVPMGAKGGFICKNLGVDFTREQTMEEVVNCYKSFIQGMLDVTDNIVDGEIVPPTDVVRYDSDDPYLVVAADKGTATFSDIANDLSIKYDFWLGDAFASGGSIGYDHKKMGITAKGAWESVKRHFREINHNCQAKDFTVVGVGDMSGDVFGNGMLLSKHIRLVGAYNHLHIFVDPNPDSAISFKERERLFALPRSSWDDYNEELISKGGGVYSRKAKFIELSKEAKVLFGLEHKERVVPNDLIKAMLKTPVDLLWNGGIGTFVKASTEHNLDVGDRANDSIRVNGDELQCKILGEGGNLGLTQLGRVEYALKGGMLNTDAIDNSAGVDCSDHEVNIKILLNSIVHSQDMTEKQRVNLLQEMTDEVSDLVLSNNRAQTGALSLSLINAPSNIEVHERLLHQLEQHANLDRELEFLPNSDEFEHRKQQGVGLSRPELSVLLAYVKISLKEEILASDLPEDPYILRYLGTAFPKILKDKYFDSMVAHRLKREIITMQVSNNIVNNVGIEFFHRLQDETGAQGPEIVRAFIIANEVFKAEEFRDALNALDFEMDASMQMRMQLEQIRLLRRATRWFLRHRRTDCDIEANIKHFQPKVKKVSDNLLSCVRGALKGYIEDYSQELIKAKVPVDLAYRTSSMSGMFSALDIVEAATEHDMSLDTIIKVYFAAGSRLELGWFREQIKRHPVANHWDALARAAYRDDLDRQQRNLTIGIMHMCNVEDVDASIDAWMDKHKNLVERWSHMVTDLKSSAKREFSMYSVALRELLELAEAGLLPKDV